MGDIRDAVSLIREPSGLNTSTSDYLQHIRELFSGPMAYASCDSPFPALLYDCPHLILLGREYYISILQTLLCDDELKEKLDSEAPGLRCRAFYIATCVAHVSVDDRGVLGLHRLLLAPCNLSAKLTSDYSYIPRIHRRFRCCGYPHGLFQLRHTSTKRG